MKIPKWIKTWLSSDSDEDYRPEFEKMKLSKDHAADLSKTAGEYHDAAIQEEWVEWVQQERLRINAW